MNDVKPDHIMALLGLVLDGLRRDLLAATRNAAARSFPPVLGDLRSSHIRMLSLTPPDGMRVSDLADRVGMTKQALGEFATALEGFGLVESVRDPADRRVRIVRPTALGREVVEASAVLIAEVETAWRERVGAGDWDRLRDLLVSTAAKGRPKAAEGGLDGGQRPSQRAEAVSTAVKGRAAAPPSGNATAG